MLYRLLEVDWNLAQRANRVLRQEPSRDTLGVEVVPSVTWQVGYVALRMFEIVHAYCAERHRRVI